MYNYLRYSWVLLGLWLYSPDLPAQVDYGDPTEMGEFPLTSVEYDEHLHSGEFSSYIPRAVRERRTVPNPYLIERDVKYCKRIIRCIDARQKMNYSFIWPKSHFTDNLFKAILANRITAYRTDSLSSRYNPERFLDRISYELPVDIIPDSSRPDEIETIMIQERIPYEDIKKFWVMEEWIFDAQRSVFFPRIVAIAPIYRPRFSVDIIVPEQPLCWIKYDDITRQEFAHWEFFNRYNDAARLSYDDVFQMRTFSSYIVFESNVFDLYINQFEEYENDGVAALLKADEIRNDLFIFEHDLWQY